MKMSELNPITGTYVGLRVSEQSHNSIRDFCANNNIPTKPGYFNRRLHTTVIYSRKQCVGLVAESERVKHKAEFIGYDLFTSEGKNCVLVMKLNAPTVVARHLQIMAQYGATYDFPVYTPHITLSYNYSGNVTDLPVYNETIVLGNEYVEDLKIDWEKYDA
jgi:hypothetical protein